MREAYNRAQKDLYEPQVTTLKQIIDDWTDEKADILYEIDTLNESLQDDFSELFDKTVNIDNFESFLEELDIEYYHNRVEVSSKYSNYTCRCFYWDTLYEVVYGYIEAIVRKNDLILDGFNVADEFFCWSINDKYGVENEDE